MGESAADVLLVEDDSDDAELLIRELRRRRPGTSVRVARDGVEALECLQNGSGIKFPPKLVILDLSLPRLNGMEVLRCLRADRRTSAIPIVVLSGTCSPEDVGATRGYGARACMRKAHSGGDLERIVDVLAKHF